MCSWFLVSWVTCSLVSWFLCRWRLALSLNRLNSFLFSFWSLRGRCLKMLSITQRLLSDWFKLQSAHLEHVVERLHLSNMNFKDWSNYHTRRQIGSWIVQKILLRNSWLLDLSIWEVWMRNQWLDFIDNRAQGWTLFRLIIQSWFLLFPLENIIRKSWLILLWLLLSDIDLDVFS